MIQLKCFISKIINYKFEQLIENIIIKFVNQINYILIGPSLRLLILIFKINQHYLFLNTNPNAIGHLCADIDCFLKECELNRYNFKGILLAYKNANSVLLKNWSSNSNLIIFTSPIICYIFDYLRIYKETGFDCSKYMAVDKQPVYVYKLYKKWGNRKPIIKWETIIQSGNRKIVQ